MGRYSDKYMPYSRQDKIWREFCKVLASMDTEDEIFRFLKDLLNRQERLMLARRLQVAFLLEAGLGYDEISAKMKVGKNTIARIARWLEFGREGYRKAIGRIVKKFGTSYDPAKYYS